MDDKAALKPSNTCFKSIDQVSSKKGNSYIVKIAGSDSKKVAVASSNLKCDVYSYGTEVFNKTFSFSELKKPACDIRFCPVNDNLIYTASEDGSIKLWDSRSGDKYVSIFEENPETSAFTKPLSSFDISCDDRILCGGSDLVENDAFMLFWDTRSKSLLGGYWNSHNNDIVQVQFHKKKTNILITGSLDGLVNVFDLCEKHESESLLYSLSIDCAVDKINWMSDDVISCLTHNIDIQYWDINTADRLKVFQRKDIAKSMNSIDMSNCYVVDVYNDLILSGSFADERNLLHLIDVSDKQLVFNSSFQDNNQIVRCSWYDSKNNLVITGGEMGILNLWKRVDSTQSNVETTKNDNVSMSSAMKKMKVHKNKPY